MTSKLASFLIPLPLVLLVLALTVGAGLSPSKRPAPSTMGPALPPEVEIGGFVLYQPFDHADSVVAEQAYTHDGKTYTQSKVRWTPVGFLCVLEDVETSERKEHWFLSKGDETSTTSSTTVPFVEKYFWPGRSTPSGDKHVYWDNLPMRFLRRNDLSGAVSVAAFTAEVMETYGYDLSATAGKFERHDATVAKSSAY